MVKVIKGDAFVDDRGTISFVNDFTFNNVRRFYTIENRDTEVIRAWKGHIKEAKYIYAVSGAAVIATVHLETEKMQRYILSSRKPAILYIPPGYANGIKTLTEDTKLIVFSTLTLQESLDDEIRYAVDRWDFDSGEEQPDP